MSISLSVLGYRCVVECPFVFRCGLLNSNAGIKFTRASPHSHNLESEIMCRVRSGISDVFSFASDNPEYATWHVVCVVGFGMSLVLN